MEDPIRDYASENSVLSYKELRNRFGEPQQIAESFIAEMEVSDLRENLKTGSRVVRILLAFITLVVFIWFGFAALAYYDVFKYENGYSVIEIEGAEEAENAEGGNK